MRFLRSYLLCEVVAHVGVAQTGPVGGRFDLQCEKQKRVSSLCSQLALCLPRACLGKLISIFQCRHLGLSFSYDCPEPGLAK